MTEPNSLVRCLNSALDQNLARRYTNMVSDGQNTMPARFFYNSALRELNAKNSEAAIQNLVVSLNLERDHQPSLHLVKTMIFGLSKKFNESGGQMYKQQYSSIEGLIRFVESEMGKRDKEVLDLQNKKKKDKNKGLWSIIEKWFFKKKKTNYDSLISQSLVKKEDLKKQLNFAIKLSQIEEFAKVLSLILEICLYPARYAWVIG